jgi:Na+-driven multidrug efflux pump
VGQSLGAGRLDEAKVYANRMIFFSVGCCTVFAGIMALVGGFFPSIYNTEESIRELASIFIFISALAMPLCAFSHCAYFTLRSGGKTGITFLFDSVYTWVLLIPFAYVLANFTALPIITVFFLVQFTEAVKVVIGFFMIKSGVWLQNIVTKKPESV